MYGGLLMAALGLAAITRNECRLALTGLLWLVLEQKVSRMLAEAAVLGGGAAGMEYGGAAGGQANMFLSVYLH